MAVPCCDHLPVKTREEELQDKKLHRLVVGNEHSYFGRPLAHSFFLLNLFLLLFFIIMFFIVDWQNSYCRTRNLSHR